MSGYTRQQSYIDGDVILAEHTNDEFDLLAEVFDTSLGHKHDGTTAEGPTIDLLSDDDGDTKIQVEEGADDDTIRFDTAATERLTIDGTGQFTANGTFQWNGNTTLNGNTTITGNVLGTPIYTVRPAFNGGTSGVDSPFTVDSTFLVSNLNADLLDGNHATAFLGAGATAVNSELLDGLDSTAFLRSNAADSVGGVLTFDAIPAFNGGISGSTAPFTVDSNTLVTNLNADLLDGVQGANYARTDIAEAFDNSVNINGNVGIGTSTTNFKLQVQSDTSGGNLLIVGTNVDNSNDAQLAFRKARGGTSTPSAILSGDDLGQIDFTGYDGTSFNTGAAIKAQSTSSTGTLGGQLLFVTNGSERVRIDSSGNLLVGTTTLSVSNDGFGFGSDRLARFSNTGASTLSVNRNGTDGIVQEIRNDGSIVGSISFSGSTTSFNTTSDYRLKENVTTLTSATSRLKELKPSRFNFIGQDMTVDGFIAHEVQAVVPEAVTGEKDGEETDGTPIFQQMDASKLIPLLVATIKELEERITILEGK